MVILSCVATSEYTFYATNFNFIMHYSSPGLEHQPLAIYPFFESEVLDKLEATVQKASAYLERSRANIWWNTWLLNARRHTTPEHCPLEGTMDSINFIINFLPLLIGDWLVKELAHATLSNATNATSSDSSHSTEFSLSGVEMESPHVKLIGDKECSYEIPGIGVIATS